MERALLIPESPGLKISAHQLKRIIGFPEARILSQIENENGTRYSEPVERLPQVRTIAGKLENMRLLSYAEAVNSLWALVNCQHLIGVPPLEDGNFEDFLLVSGDEKITVEIFTEVCEALTKEHQNLFNNQLPLKSIRYRHEDKLGADRQVTTNRERSFLLLLQTFIAMEDFLEAEKISAERLEAHRLGVFDALGAAYGATETTMAGEAPRPGLPAPAHKNDPHRRATDDPAWRDYEKNNPGKDWDKVRRIFGDDFTIRLLLRRNEFDVLLEMLREFRLEIPERVLCHYSKQVQRFGAVAPESAENLATFNAFIGPALQVLPCEGKEELCDPVRHRCTSLHAPGSMHATAATRLKEKQTGRIPWEMPR